MTRRPILPDLATSAQIILSLAVLVLCGLAAGDCLASPAPVAHHDQWPPPGDKPATSEVLP